MALVSGALCACSCPSPPPAPPVPPPPPLPAAKVECPKVNPYYDPTVIHATEAELRESHVRITYRGPQTSIIATVAFRSPAADEIPAPMWVVFRMPLREEQNDVWLWTGHEIPVSVAEIKRMVDGAAGVVTRKDLLGGSGRISFAVVVRRDGRLVGSEYLLNSHAEKAGGELYQRLIDALDPSSTLARDALKCQRLRVGWGPDTDAPSCERRKNP